METNHITLDFFKKRTIALCLRSGMKDFPTKYQDQMIILKSIAVLFKENHSYRESEVNETIKQWLGMMEFFSAWDHITLRRRLIDARFLFRSRDGQSYQIDPSGPRALTFDPAIAGLNIGEVIREGQHEIARRKAEFLQKESHHEPISR